MRETKSNSFDVNVLKNRISVSDRELAVLLGTGIPTARKIAESACAVFYVGRRKRNNVRKIRDYVDGISE